MSKRCEQVSSELQHQLSELINKEIELPADCLITIMNVKISPDLKTAKIFISVLPENKNGTVLNQLKKSTNIIRKELKSKIKFYTLPKLQFFIDEGEIKRRKINEILNNLE